MVGIWVKSSRMSGHVSDPCFREIPPSGLKIPLIIEVEILHSAADHLHTYIKMITFLLYMILIYRWYILYTDTPYRSLIERTYYQTVSTVSPKFGSKIHTTTKQLDTTGNLSSFFLVCSTFLEAIAFVRSIQNLRCLPPHLWRPFFLIFPVGSTRVMFLTTWGSEEMQGGRSKYIQIPKHCSWREIGILDLQRICWSNLSTVRSRSAGT